ncbi:MAG: hypothetical protein JNK04_22200, partial [Myxococcales bacterium]|nr:hypothetical protein [Myxococcales bacterium]
GRAAGGEVATDDYVWEPSRGWLSDLVGGRGVVFLARHSAEEPRDAYRARVRVTPGGRPLSLRDSERLTASAIGDEGDLVVAGGYAGFTTRFDGHCQSVTTVSLVDGSPRSAVAFPHPPASADFEIRSGELLVAWDQQVTVFDLANGVAVAGTPLPFLRLPALSADDAVGSESITRWAPTEGGTPFPPPGFTGARVLAPGREPAIATLESGPIAGVALDGRQLRFAVVPGPLAPHSATGFHAAGEGVPNPGNAKLVFAMPIPMRPAPKSGGAFVNGDWIGPIEAGRIVVGTTAGGELVLGGWSLGPWELPPEANAGVQWSGGAGTGGRHAVCATPSGSFVVVWSATAADDALRAAMSPACSVAFVAPGMVEGAQWEGDISDKASNGPLLLAWAASVEPSVAAPKGSQWLPAEGSLPAPAFLPAVYRARTEGLGAAITISEIDASRFDWRIIAGREERSHRKKGTFPETLPDSDRGRAKIAFSLGTGKRKRPRGLRIAGSIGHDFSHKEPVLAATDGLLSLVGGGVLPDSGDACELASTISGGELLDAARAPLPRQAVADLCVLPGGRVLVAESTFDSHEATAGALLALGCESAVALDRGSERAAWRRDGAEAAGPFETTALVGLERPLVGVVRGREWQPPKTEP